MGIPIDSNPELTATLLELRAYIVRLRPAAIWRLIRIEPDDIVQDVVVRLLGSAPGRFTDLADWLGYACVMSRNLLQDRLRRHRRYLLKENEINEHCVQSSCYLNAVEEIERLERRLTAAQLFEHLNPEERLLMHWFFFDNWSIGQIADTLAVSERTCRRRIHLLLAKLRRAALGDPAKEMRGARKSLVAKRSDQND